MDSSCALCLHSFPLSALVVVRVDGRVTVACRPCAAGLEVICRTA